MEQQSDYDIIELKMGHDKNKLARKWIISTIDYIRSIESQKTITIVVH